MAVPLDPDLPETVAQLATPHGPYVLSNLGDRLGVSASNWDGRELRAFRVLKHAAAWQKDVLPPLRDNHKQSCPICYPGPSSSQTVNTDMIDHLRTPVSRLRTASESFLFGLPAGRFRLALARLIRSDFRDEGRKYSTREGAGNRQAAHYPGFVPSSTISIPESSSPARPSSSEYSGSHASVPLDDDQNESRARKPELLVTELAKELFYLSLYSVLEQSNPVEEFCFRPESYISRAVIAGQTIVGADDGGLCKKRFQSSSWTTIHPSLIMGECKPASQNLFYDDRTEKYFPVLTVKALAQVVGEAVTCWKQQSTTERFRDGVYSYMCNGTSIRFFHLVFGSHFDDYLNAPTENAQLDLVRDHPEDTCIRVSSTKWLDLEKPKDVILSICHILTRLRLEEGHEAEPQSEATPELEMETSRTSSESDYSVEM
ncbi:hypothetical protein LEL_10537 [Akanthomyces lecanii RCEF 1005]|uniref:Uncharacterized protein n=1 Tax=Akanthomyces lecanii RCEF 1005 TaxID=1081108 RepID=A0A162MQ04_CORDF|nr:hypothetical protein LEL_10537 [Akanthomyces lecanii RCEF 1005]